MKAGRILVLEDGTLQILRVEKKISVLPRWICREVADIPVLDPVLVAEVLDDEIQVALSNQNETPAPLLLDLLNQLIHSLFVGYNVFEGPFKISITAEGDGLHTRRRNHILDVAVVDLLHLQ